MSVLTQDAGERPPPLSLVSATLSLARDAFGVLGHRLLLLLALTVVSALTEGMTLAMLLPLFASLGFGGPGADANIITATVTRLYDALGVAVTAPSVGVLLLVLLAVSAVIFLAQSYLAARLQTAYVAHWQRRLFDTVAEAGWPFLRRQRAGDIVGGLSTEASRLGGAFYQANLIASSVIFLVVQIFIAALIAPFITIAMLLLAVVLFVATQRLVHRALQIGSELTEANAELYATAGELMGAMKLVKATAHEGQAKARLAPQIDRIRTLTFRNNFDVQIVRAVFEYSSGAAIALLLIGGPLLLGIDVAAVVIVVAIFGRLFPKVTGLRQCVQSIGLALPAYTTLRALTNAADAAREVARPATGPVPAGPAAIRLERVCARGGAGEPVLDDISLDIAPGSFVAVVGPTGAGKTTLVDCVLGLVTPASGQVLIDGRPLASIAIADWRRSVGYLGQDPVLFAGSIRDNVRWGRTRDDTAVADALQAADAAFAWCLPAGLDTDIRDHGSSLSGGERQRIALARALVGTPRLLILDEATSALDVETERNIAEAMRARRGRTTFLAITHRIASVRDADLVVMLENGRIVEQGSFASLQAAQGRFAGFCMTQQDPAAAAANLLQTAT